MPTAAVVVTWEGGPTTDRCIDSLRAQREPPAEIIVVDNASSAGERARLEQAVAARPGVRLVALDVNRQFAGGLNAGAHAAFAAGADRALLLNNDTVLAPDALARLGAALDTVPAAGIAGPLVIDLGEPRRVLSAGERHVLAPTLLCVPRTLLRHRRRARGPYPVVTSAALYALRGRLDVVRAMSRGAAAGLGGATDPPPARA